MRRACLAYAERFLPMSLRSAAMIVVIAPVLGSLDPFAAARPEGPASREVAGGGCSGLSSAASRPRSLAASTDRAPVVESGARPGQARDSAASHSPGPAT